MQAVDKFSRKEKFLRTLVTSRPLVEAIVHQLNCAKKTLQETKPDTEAEHEELEKAAERAKHASNVLKVILIVITINNKNIKAETNMFGT